MMQFRRAVAASNALSPVSRVAILSNLVWLFCACVLDSGVACAQFTTVINSPPETEVWSVYQSNTQVNIWDGGRIRRDSQLGRTRPDSANIEANLYGGSIGSSLDIYVGSTLNVFGGTVDDSLNAWNGSVVNLVGGHIRQGFATNTGSVLNASGGTIDGLTAKSGSVVNFSGGTHGGFRADNGSVVDISGGTFGNGLSIYGEGNISGGIIGDKATFNSESGIHITGGTIGKLFVGGGNLEMSGGSIGSSGKFNYGTFSVSGGTIGAYLRAQAQSEINVSGGSIGFGFYTESGSTVNLSGGVMGDSIQVSPGSAITILGGSFRLDGVAIPGLDEIGSTRPFDLAEGTTLTGVMADGTPFAYNSLDGDRLPTGTLTLKTVDLPAIEPVSLDARHDPVPWGIRAGQSLTVPSWSTVAGQFMAGENSSVVISGGSVGPRFESIGGHVSITGGEVGYGFDAFRGSIVDVSGGTIDEEMQAFAGSVVNLSGGAIRQRFRALAGSEINIAGGSISDRFEVTAGSAITIAGGEFRLDGELISGLDTPGATLPFDIPTGSVLSGTLADGTPFAFSSINGDTIADGTIALQATPLPAANHMVFHVPNDPAPLGIRSGQSIVVAEGGVVPAQFSAGRGSSVTITGGEVGDNFEAVGAEVTISGGVVEDFTAWNSTVELSGGTVGVAWDSALRVSGNSIANISGGTFKNGSVSDRSVVNMSGGSGRMQVDSESVVNVTGGDVDIDVHEMSTVNVHGGNVNISVEQSTANVYGGELDYGTTVRSGGVISFFGGTAGGGFDAIAGATLNILGGNLVGDLEAHEGSQLNISGGTIGDRFVAKSGSRVRFLGSDFRIDGTPVEGLKSTGNTVMVNVPYGSWITGTFADGTPFAFSGNELDTITDGTLTLEASPIAAGPSVFHVPTDASPLGVHEGQTLVVSEGGQLPNNFNAGRGSSVVVNAGTVGENFEAVGANVSITGGSIGPNSDAIGDSVVTISGGNIGEYLEAFHSVVNISGGSVGHHMSAHDGSNVNISGGTIGPSLRGYAGSTINISAGVVQGLTGEGGGINISGGTVWNANSYDGTVLSIAGGYVIGVNAGQSSITEISGGRVGSLLSWQGSTGSIVGGSIDGQLLVEQGAEVKIAGGSIAGWVTARGVVKISGGTFGDSFEAEYGSQVTILGNEFRINGTPVSGLEEIGNTVDFDGIFGSLTGTFADGSPFAFSYRDDDLGQGRFTLKAVALPDVVPGEVNLPGDHAPSGIRGGQSLSVADGGSLPNNFTAGRGSTVVMSGGNVGYNFEAAGAHVVVAAGSIGDGFDALHGSTIEINGGVFGSWVQVFGSDLEVSGGAFEGSFFVEDGTIANIAGGTFADSFGVSTDSVANISGGEFGRIAVDTGGQLNISGGALRDELRVYTQSSLTLIGNDFRLDGVPISGLETIGDKVQLTARGAMLTGTLSDGTPFSLESSSGYQYSDGTVTLQASAIESGPQFIDLPHDPVPLGVSRGQTLLVGEGAFLPSGYDAGVGSTVHVDGGKIDSGLIASGAVVDITKGEIGQGFRAIHGSVVHLSGGEIGDHFEARVGSQVSISGGTVGQEFWAAEDSVVRIAGGKVERGFDAGYRSTVVISGGSVDGFTSSSGSSVTISGGAFGDGLRAYEQSLRIVGGEFRVNGELVDTSEFTEEWNQISTGPGKFLSGTLADGTPFNFSFSDDDAVIGPYSTYGSIEIQIATLPPTGPAHIDAAADTVPAGIRSGQTITVHDSAVLPDNFNAGHGSTVHMTGGQIGDNFEAVGAEVNIADGVIGDEFDAFAGSIINIHGGTFGEHFSVHDGAVANILGGTFGSRLELLSGGQIHLFGDHFLLDESPIEGLVRGQSLTLTERDVTLSGVLADGSEFSFDLATNSYYDSERFAADALLTLSIVPIPEPATLVTFMMGIPAILLLKLRRRVGPGHAILSSGQS